MAFLKFKLLWICGFSLVKYWKCWATLNSNVWSHWSSIWKRRRRRPASSSSPSSLESFLSRRMRMFVKSVCAESTISILPCIIPIKTKQINSKSTLFSWVHVSHNVMQDVIQLGTTYVSPHEKNHWRKSTLPCRSTLFSNCSLGIAAHFWGYSLIREHST